RRYLEDVQVREIENLGKGCAGSQQHIAGAEERVKKVNLFEQRVILTQCNRADGDEAADGRRHDRDHEGDDQHPRAAHRDREENRDQRQRGEDEPVVGVVDQEESDDGEEVGEGGDRQSTFERRRCCPCPPAPQECQHQEYGGVEQELTALPVNRVDEGGE